MTAALQNPDNHERITAAAKAAPSYIADLEAEMGMTHPAGRIGQVESFNLREALKSADYGEPPIPIFHSHSIEEPSACDNPNCSIDLTTDWYWWAWIQGCVTKCQSKDDPTFAHIWPPDEAAQGKTRRERIIAIAVACLCVVALWYACAHAGQYDFVGPIPDLSAQRCVVRSRDNILTISCDSSRVCPPGWALHTQMIPPLSGRTLEEVLGYGDATEVTNSCVTAGQGISTDGGRHYEASVGVMK